MGRKIRNQSFKLVAISLILATSVSIWSGSVRAFDPRDCPDPKEVWYECYQKLSDVNRYVNAWCSNADSKKRPECQLVLLDSLDYTPQYLQNDDDDCKTATAAVKNKNKCWVVLKSSSDWYDYLKRYGDECGFVEVAEECQVIDDFLEDNGWAVDESATTGIGGDIDQSDPKNTPFIRRVTIYFRWLVIGIGVLGVFSIVIAGIQYAAAQDNAQSVAAAKQRITNVVIGVLIYFVMFAALQWLIPGGLF